MVRTISMTSTDGIQCGESVEDTGLPIQTPVGEPVLGRVLNVLGDPIDDGENLIKKLSVVASIQHLQILPNKMMLLKYLKRVSKSSISFVLLSSEEKLLFSEVQESERL